MSDVIEIHGNCQAMACKRGDKIITKETGSVVVGDKQYHPGCEPSQAEQEAQNRSST